MIGRWIFYAIYGIILLSISVIINNIPTGIVGSIILLIAHHLCFYHNNGDKE